MSAKINDLIHALSLCNPATQHFEISQDQKGKGLVIKEGGVQEALTLPTYDVWQGPCTFPEKGELVERTFKIVDLMTCFEGLLQGISKLERADEHKDDYGKIKSVIELQANGSLWGKEERHQFLDLFRPSWIVQSNQSIREAQIRLGKQFKHTMESLQQISEMKKELKNLKMTDESVIQKLVMASRSRLYHKLTEEEFKKEIESHCDSKNSELKEYLEGLRLAIEDKFVCEWSPFPIKPPQELNLSKLAMDFLVLYRRLTSYFPEGNQPFYEARDKTEVFDLCEKIMVMGSRLMDAVYADLGVWIKDQALDDEHKIDLLTTIPSQNKIGKATYAYFAFIYLSMAYRLVSSLHQNMVIDHKKNPHKNFSFLPKNWRSLFFTSGTLQLQWRLDYNKKYDQVMKLLSKTKLKKISPIHFAWAKPDDSEKVLLPRKEAELPK